LNNKRELKAYSPEDTRLSDLLIVADKDVILKRLLKQLNEFARNVELSDKYYSFIAHSKENDTQI